MNPTPPPTHDTAASARRPRITITGFGDVGQAYAAALVAQGLSPRIHHPAPRERATAAARALGLTIHTDPAAAYGECDLVLNVAPGSQALAVARGALAAMPRAALFADLSSAAPASLREAAALFPDEGYVDVAILGAVSIHGHRTPLLASGPAATRLKALLEPFEFAVEVMDGAAAGDATALKLVRSVLTKGMDAVVVECLLVAEALGMREALLARMADLDRSTLSELMAMFVRTHAPHAQRRLHEVQAIEDTLAGLGIPLIVTPAVRARYVRTIEVLGADAQLPRLPENGSLYDRALPWMLEAERRSPVAPAPSAHPEPGHDAPVARKDPSS